MAKKKKADADADLDTDAEEGAEGSGGKKKLPLRLILIAAAAVLVLGGGGTGAYLKFAGPKDAKATVAPVKPVVFVDLPELLVNLANVPNERTQYLKVKVVLEVADQALIAQIQPVMPRVMDAFQTHLRELRPTDLDGSAGLFRLKEELMRRVNVAIAPARINAVLFKEMLVQ
jgi:flagellar FliL protein